MPLINPLLFAVNRTPNSSGLVSFVSCDNGTVVLGQIVHGQVGGGLLAVTVMLRFACTVCAGLLESVTFTAKFVVPEPLGVPEIAPEVDNVNPAGRFVPDTSVQA